MQNELNESQILRIFRERTTAELRFALDDVKWWKEKVALGLVKPEHAVGYIEAAERIINVKRHVLGFPQFPC